MGVLLRRQSRTRQVRLNHRGRAFRGMTSAGSILADTVSYALGVACPTHYHEGTEHFFSVIEGEGVVEIEGDEHEVTAGRVVWIGEGDEQRLLVPPDQAGMRLLESFSNGHYETVYTEGKACTGTSDPG